MKNHKTKGTDYFFFKARWALRSSRHQQSADWTAYILPIKVTSMRTGEELCCATDDSLIPLWVFKVVFLPQWLPTHLPCPTPHIQTYARRFQEGRKPTQEAQNEQDSNVLSAGVLASNQFSQTLVRYSNYHNIIQIIITQHWVFDLLIILSSIPSLLPS